MKEMLLATRNLNKIREISAIIPAGSFAVKTFNDYPEMPEVEEDGLTLRENAEKKAFICSSYSGSWALADDTGLEVEFLSGAPGVYSARWAGPGCSYSDNNLKLLESLKGVPADKRKADFVCVISICSPSGELRSFQGKLSGFISEKSSGEKGFGYDPVFFVPAHSMTLAELSPEIKNRISHRAAALSAAAVYLRKISASK